MKEKALKVLKSPYTYVYLVFAAFYFWIASQVPYTHDDWDWGLQQGMNQLFNATLNGRYAGNLFEVIMTRSEIAKTLILGSGYFLIPFLLSFLACKSMKITGKLRPLCFLLCNILLLTMDRAIWQQTYGWVAGFANFCISAIFMMIWIREIDFAFQKDISTPPFSVVKSIGLGVVCVVAQLFLENISIYTVILSIFLNVIYYKRIRKIPLRNVFMLVGAVAGLLITFSSSIYDTLWSTGEAIDGYRKFTLMSGGGVKSTVYSLVIQVYLLSTRTFGNNLILMLLVSILLTVHLLKGNNKSRWVCRFLSVVNILFIVYFLSHYFYDDVFMLDTIYSGLEKVIMALNSAMSILYFCAVVFEIVVLFKNSKWFMGKMLVIWLSAPAVILPLVVTSEIGARLFFTSNIFIILFSAILFMQILKDASFKAKACVSVACLAISAVLLFSHGWIYAEIGKCTKERTAAIEKALTEEASVVVLSKYPHGEYLWYPDPLSDRWDYFRQFYGIPENIEIIIG